MLSLNIVLNIDGSASVLQMESLSLEAPMEKYITVANRRNKVATVHVLTCPYVRGGVEVQSENTTRRAFVDGIEALEFAEASQPANYDFCSHCLASAIRLLRRG
ncbi:hypothetical protein ACM43_34405 [Bradyrhizobium sp. CCBAU 45321]|uniref:hypothetical protein n=1 Tax=Bradyrhizobium sp. CCBAU 45321 TaxID=1641878 RepID=UPI0023034B3B|nr:hypothetical protein [Bradyrhizobium sp. CCBAU 45321]MDA9549459.1 hypothetical protein [Bradyrhizobium sp. CCBAU 45321]